MKECRRVEELQEQEPHLTYVVSEDKDVIMI